MATDVSASEMGITMQAPSAEGAFPKPKAIETPQVQENAPEKKKTGFGAWVSKVLGRDKTQVRLENYVQNVKTDVLPAADAAQAGLTADFMKHEGIDNTPQVRPTVPDWAQRRDVSPVVARNEAKQGIPGDVTPYITRQAETVQTDATAATVVQANAPLSPDVKPQPVNSWAVDKNKI